jgi:excisionase family DNA binding protein
MNILLQDGLLSINQAAEFLAVSRRTVYSLMESGQLAYTKIGALRRIPRRALIDLAAKGLTDPREQHA